MYSIKHLYHLEAPIEQVFEALTSIDKLKGWWTSHTFGSPQLGALLHFNFPPYAENSMEVVAIEPLSKVGWRCIAGTPDWINTEISFQLDENENKTRMRFAHKHWQTNGDFYAQCSYSWGRYLYSLKLLLETGKGTPFT